MVERWILCFCMMVLFLLILLLGRIAQGDNPAEQRELDHRAITVKELCERYLADAKAGGLSRPRLRPW